MSRTLTVDQVDEFVRLLGRLPSDGEAVLMSRAGLDASDYLALAGAIDTLATVTRWPAHVAGCAVFGALVGDSPGYSKLNEATRGRPGLADGLALLASLLREAVEHSDRRAGDPHTVEGCELWADPDHDGPCP